MTYPGRLFDAFMFPLEVLGIGAKRRQLLPLASGDVLELGAGTGVNLGHYRPEQLRSLTVTDLEPSDLLRLRADELRHRATRVAVNVQAADADALPFADASFDTVVFTLVFCSVPDQNRALAEVRRVLRPEGRIIFIEHVRPHGSLGRIADRLNPVWCATTGECNINRDTAGAIRAAGFSLDRFKVSGASALISGVATS